MSPDLIALVLFAAVLHAGWNALAKSGGSPLYSIAAYRLVSATASLCLVWWAPLPPAGAWPFLAASVLIHTVYYFTLAQAYRSGDLSLVCTRSSWPLGHHFRRPVLIAATIADGAGVRTVENSLSYILWLFAGEALPGALHGGTCGVIRNRARVLVGGLASTAAYGLVIHAMSIGPMALVIAGKPA